MGNDSQRGNGPDSLTRHQAAALEESALSWRNLEEVQQLMIYLAMCDEGLMNMVLVDGNWNQLLNKQRWGDLASQTSVRLYIALLIEAQTKNEENRRNLAESIQKWKNEVSGRIGQTALAERCATSSEPAAAG